MVRRRLQKFALYSLSSEMLGRTAEQPPEPSAPLQGSEKEVDIVVLTRKVGESVLVPARGLTIQVGSIQRDRVSLRITVPPATNVFRLGVPVDPANDTESSGAAPSPCEGKKLRGTSPTRV